MDKIDLNTGQFIFKAGEKSDKVFLLLEGEQGGVKGISVQLFFLIILSVKLLAKLNNLEPVSDKARRLIIII